MDQGIISMLSVTTYKLACLAVGFGFGYLGYKLFAKGIWGDSGTVEGSFGDNSILIKKAAPGTFFAVFGAIILGFTIFKGLAVTTNSYTGENNATQATNNTEKPPKPEFSTKPEKPSFNN